MRNFKLTITFLVLIFSARSATAFSGLWNQVDNTKVPAKGEQVQHPKKYLVFSLTTESLKQALFSLPSNPEKAIIIELPMADGTMKDFKVWQTPMMPDALADRYPNIKTFTAEAVGNRTITAKLDFTEYGFHAMVFAGDNTSFIDPLTREDQNYYMVHFKKDETRPASERMRCLVQSGADKELQQTEAITMPGAPLPKLAARTVNGYTLRSYRLALSADFQYCQAATGSSTPTIAQALSAMTTTMNRVNGVYERDFSITMNFVTAEDTLIWTQSTGTVNGNDPFNNPTNINGNANSCLSKNQSTCTSRIGTANFDIGHVFTTGAGGLSQLGVICSSNQKARSVTGSSSPVGDGFDIDYVAHEMGHEYGSEHTFNDNTNGSCGGNAVQAYAYEPGSGSTIMAYAGICDNPVGDDLQFHSDPYFVNSSLLQIYSHTITGSGNACAVATATNNKPVSIAAFTATYSIPYKTPFELIAPTAVDSVADTLTSYCWEEWDLGDFGLALADTYFNGPIFRSYNPTTSATRVFPKLSNVLSGVLSDVGTEGAQGEKAPDTARDLTFRLTIRDIFQGNGCFLFPDDSIKLHAINTGIGFSVTSQNSPLTTYTGASNQTVTWNVASTTAAPISCANVDIYFSTDAGLTWPTHLGNFPNNGSASVTIPNVATTSSARIKVKGTGNVFFNVNAYNFTVNHSNSVEELNTLANDVKIYPVPAVNTLNISCSLDKTLNVQISNTVGQTIFRTSLNKSLAIPVNAWPKGVYFVQVFDTENGNRTVKSIVVE